MIFGVHGVYQYQLVRKDAISKLDSRIRPGSSDGFHDGTDVLPEVQKWHQHLRSSMRATDGMTDRVLDLVDDRMLTALPMQRIQFRDLCRTLASLLENEQRAIRTPAVRPFHFWRGHFPTAPSVTWHCQKQIGSRRRRVMSMTTSYEEDRLFQISHCGFDQDVYSSLTGRPLCRAYRYGISRPRSQYSEILLDPVTLAYQEALGSPMETMILAQDASRPWADQHKSSCHSL